MRNPTIRPTHAVIPAMVLAAGPGAHGAQAQSAGELPQRADVLLAGSITDAAGEPMEGVVVSVRATASNLTTSVYTDGDGEYVFPRTAAGSYQLWAQAVSYEAGRADPELRGAMQRQDFVLESLENFEAQLPGDRWVAALPEDTPEDRRMKTVFRVSCGGCHSQNTALLTRFDEQGWLNIITVMSRIATAGWVASPMAPGPAREDRPPSPLMDYDRRLDGIRTPVLGHYAEYDFQTTAQALATKRRLGERFTYHVYPDMDRGFAGGGSGAIDYVALVRGRDGGAAESTDEGAPAAVADAVRLAWERTLSFLR